MKKTINIITLIFGLSFFFTGCYTIVWDPREEFPDSENSSTEGSGFYESDYYGGYVDYYESPWWISAPVYITYPGETDNSKTKDRNNGRSSDTENIRNSNGRGNTDRNSGVNTGNTTTTTTTNSGNSNNSNVVTPPPPTGDSNSGNTNNTSTSSSTSNTRNSGSNETRNSSGSRNSGSGRK